MNDIDVFISYKHPRSNSLQKLTSLLQSNYRQDREFARGLKRRLYEKQVRHVWMDEDIHGGANWGNDIFHALKEARVIVVVVSPDSMYSAFVTYEWCIAHFGLSKLLYPVHLGGCGSATGVFGCLERTQIQMKNVHAPPTHEEWEDIAVEIKGILDVPPPVTKARRTLISDTNDDGSSITRLDRENAANTLKRYNTLASRKYLMEALEYQMKPGKGDGVVQKAIAEAIYDVGQRQDLYTISLLCRLLEHTEDRNVHTSTIKTLVKLTA